jgi:hypothetical protein
VLPFERQVVHALMSPSLDASARTAVESYVDETLRSMPEYIRYGVVAESLTLGVVPTVERLVGRYDDDALRARLERWKNSKIDVIRQYVRLLESLVLFGEQELVPESAASGTA